jgi:hypothetical protein
MRKVVFSSTCLSSPRHFGNSFGLNFVKNSASGISANTDSYQHGREGRRGSVLYVMEGEGGRKGAGSWTELSFLSALALYLSEIEDLLKLRFIYLGGKGQTQLSGLV